MEWHKINPPGEVFEACDPNMPIGQTTRKLHKYRVDGTPCSLHKEAAMNVRRTKEGWTFSCFRCGAFGDVPLDRSSPKETKAMIESKEKRYSTVVKNNAVWMPRDCVRLVHSDNNAAKNWLSQYGILDRLWSKYGIKWSENYKRIIFPIYKVEGPTISLLGWVGRDPYYKTKSERVEKKIPKYLTRKNPKAPRMYFITQFEEKMRDKDDILIIVEDIVSAIRVHEATGVATLALLNSSITMSTLMKEGYKKVLFWLDADAFDKAVKATTRYNSLGYTCRVNRTENDPKVYSDQVIQQKLKPILEGFDGEDTKD